MTTPLSERQHSEAPGSICSSEQVKQIDMAKIGKREWKSTEKAQQEKQERKRITESKVDVWLEGR